MKVFTQNEARLVRMLAECFIPRASNAKFDAIDANAVEFLDDWMSQLPQADRLKARGLFNMFEYYVAVDRMSPFARFTSLNRDDQMAYLASWEQSSLFARRLAFQGIRSMITIAHCESRKVRGEMGLPTTNAELDEHMARLAKAAEMLGVK